MKKKIIIGLIILGLIAYTMLALKEDSSPKVGLIRIEGAITDYLDIVSLISNAEKNNSIKAVVIQVDSPGGAVGASQEIYRAIERLRNCLA